MIACDVLPVAMFDIIFLECLPPFTASTLLERALLNIQFCQRQGNVFFCGCEYTADEWVWMIYYSQEEVRTINVHSYIYEHTSCMINDKALNIDHV